MAAPIEEPATAIAAPSRAAHAAVGPVPGALDALGALTGRAALVAVVSARPVAFLVAAWHEIHRLFGL